mmetsp:Transcript_2398/g.9726  ORF Transcript_2398/g.9726 Transcript_2398/m.9726 type:complete len:219 (-) Transcript_2398:414-1070(-)
MPHRRHLLADGDGIVHDHPAAGRHPAQARVRHPPFLRRPARGARRQGRRARGRGLGFFGHQETLAVRVSILLRRSRAVRERVLLHVQGLLRRRRRVQARRRRILLDHRQGGRRHQRLRPPHGNRGGGIRPRAAPGVLGSRRRRHAPRDQGRGHLLLRRAQGRAGPERRAGGGAQGDRTEGDRAHRHPRRHPVLGGSAEDPLGEDHAAHPAKARREPRD